MAVVGEAHIVVRAITTGIADEIERALKEARTGVDKEGNRLGKDLSAGIKKGFNSKKGGIFGDLLDVDAAEKARQAFATLQRTGMTLQTGLGALAGTIGAVINALGSLIGSAGGAAGALVAVAGAGVGLALGMKLAGMALGGVTKPLQQVNSAAGKTGKTVAQLREEMQQLRFEAEGAALSEKEAALSLEKARESLARVQDLPPNSMARREAELSYEQADLALRKAIDRNNDLQEEIKNGPKQDSGTGKDPYQGLTASQKVFAKLLVSLKPKFDALKEAVAKGFLPALATGINTLMTKNFPTLEKGFSRIGDALGTVAKKIFDVLDAADGTGALTSLFETSGKVIEALGSAFGDYFGAFLDILDAAAPLTEKFVSFISKGAKEFKDFIAKAKGNGDLTKFFEDAGRVAKDFGDIANNIFGGLGALIADSLKPGSGGDILLQFFKDATQGFADIGKDPGFSQLMKDSATNATKLFDVLGDLLGVFIGLGGDPSLGKAFDILKGGIEPLKKLLENGIAASDELAALAVSLVEIGAAFGDAGQLEAFFGTLKNIADTIVNILNDERVKPILAVLGPLVGTFLALGLALKIGSFGFKVLLGNYNLFVKSFKTFGKVAAAPFNFFLKKDLDTGMTQFIKLRKIAGGALRQIGERAKDAAVFVGTNLKKAYLGAASGVKNFALAVSKSTIVTKLAAAAQAAYNFILNLNPITLIVIAVLALVAALIYFFTQTEIGKQIWQGFMDFMKIAFDGLMVAFKAVGDFFVAVWNGLVDAVKSVFELIVAAITFYISIWVNIFKTIVGFIIAVWDGLVTGISAAIGTVVGFFEDAWNGVTGFFKGFVNGLISLFEGFINFVIDGINGLLENINIGVGFLGELIGQKWEIALIPRLKIPRLAKGGVVSPSNGGSLVNVAEAGRPERIEPLDENGMSKRDKAMIAALSNGSGGGVNITVNPSPGMNETELANIVSRQLAFQLRAGGI